MFKIYNNQDHSAAKPKGRPPAPKAKLSGMDSNKAIKDILGQDDLIRTQAQIIAAEIQKRVRRGYFIEDVDDLDGFVNGITQFRGELVAMEQYLKRL